MEENKLDDFCKTIGEVCTDFIETQEEFIFQTVSKWLSNNYMTVVSKKELINAVTMISANAYVDGYAAGRKTGRQEMIKEMIKEMIDTFKEDTCK